MSNTKRTMAIFGRRATTVVLSALMVFSSVPTAALAEGLEEAQAATEQLAEQLAQGEDQQDTSAETTPAEDTSAEGASSEEGSAEESSQAEPAADEASDEQEAAEQPAEQQATEADIALSGLDHATIELANGQQLGTGSTKVTVSTSSDFKFTAEPNEGYSLTAVRLTVAGNKSELATNGDGYYTVSAADIVSGASLTLETEEAAEANNASANAISLTSEDESDDQSSRVNKLATESECSISGDAAVTMGESITLTFEGPEGSKAQGWADNSGAFDLTVAEDGQSVVATAKTGWVFNGTSKDCGIVCWYTDAQGAWHTGDTQLVKTVKVNKRTFKVVAPETVNAYGSHYVFPTLVDAATGEEVSWTGEAGDAFTFNYYKDGEYICNQSLMKSDGAKYLAALTGPGEYTVEVVPNDGYYYAGDPQTVVIPEDYTKPTDTETEKYIYVGDTLEIEGTDASYHRWTYEEGDVLSVSVEKNRRAETNKATVTGLKVGDVTLKHESSSTSWFWPETTDTITVHVIKKAPASSLTISGPDTVEQFKNITLTTDADTDVTWTSSDPSVATIDANGKVVGVKEGTVTITATTVTAEGKVLTATHDVTVTKSSTSGKYNAKFTSTIENADVVYFNWHNSSDVNNVAFTPATSSFTVNDYTTSTESGYVVFFVKPNDNYIITGLGASGAGQMYAVDATSWGAINGYPGISTVMAAAKVAGYVAAFGYSRSPRNSMTQSFEVSAKSPDMLIAATSNQTKDVAAGDELTFTVTITPQTTGSGKDHATGVKVNSAEVNGTEVTVENLTQNSDGTYTGYVHYTATDNDCNRGSVVLTVEATTTYEGSFTITSGGITTGAEVTKSATCACQIAPESQVKYQFVSGTTGVALPSAINGFLPWDNNSYKANKTVKAKDPSQTEYADSKNDGYWTFDGWDHDSVETKRSGETVTFTGTWTFTKYSKYTINYVDENGNKIAESKTVGQKKVGDKVKASEVEKPEIEGYTYGKTSSDITIAADESKNVITVTYKRKAGKAGYNLVLDSASWTAPEKTTNTEKMKWYFDYGFAEGDTFTVTNSEPIAADHVFIGWMDKARDGQAAAIRKAGEKVTYCYSKNQTYTLDALWASLSATGEDVTYDGKSHTVTVDVKINDGTGLDAKYVEQAKQLITAGDVQYSTDGGNTWSAEKPSFKDAGTYVVQVKQDVTVGGATTTLTAETQVKIAQKEYFVKTNTESKPYDGSKLVGTATVEGLVDGESAAATATTVGPNVTASTTNAVTGEIAWAEGAKSTNYKRGTDELGTLEITKGELTLNAAAYSGKYDGKAHGETAQVNVTEGTTVEYSTDGGKTWGTSVPTVKDVAKIDVKVRATNLNYESAEADYTLEVTKRDVTLTSASDEKAYDGTALTNDTVTVGGDGFVNGEGATYKVTGSQTSVGSSDNTFTYTLNSNTKAENYNITKSEGKLTVKYRNESEKYKITVEGNSTSVPYDGAEHSAAGITKDSKTFKNDKGATFTVTADTTDPKSTDVATKANKVSNVKVTDASGNDVTSQFKVTTKDGSLTITKKSATITAGTAEKEYDGKALTTDQFTTDGFVKGQGIASATIEGSQTVVGSTRSTVKANSWKAKDGTNLDNYEITTVAGKLTVTNRTAKYQVTLEGIEQTKTYDGTEQKVWGIKINGAESDKFEIDGVEYQVYNYKSDVTGTDAGEYTQTVTSANADGHWTIKDANGNDVSGQFSVTTKSGKLAIAPKDVTITSGSDSKAYDGTALTKHEASVTAGGFVDGEEEGVSYTYSGSQTDAGSSDNTFEVVFDGTTAKAGNYKVTKVPGTLTVNAVADKVTVTITEHGGTYTYDGTQKSATGYDVFSNNELYTANNLTFSGNASVAGTDAGTYEMQLKAEDFRNTSANFTNVEFVIVDGTLTIGKRNVTLTSASDTKVYDGSALTNKSVTVSGDDFAKNEGASYDVTGTITNAGSVDNEFGYTLDEGTKAKNYNIKTENGTLTVAPVTTKVTVTISGKKVSEKYNGGSQKASGYTVSIDNSLYKESDFEFSGTAEVEKTDAGTYAMGLKASDFENKSDNFSNVEFMVTDGELAISKRELELISATDTKPYDGTALTNSDVHVDGDDFAEGEGATYSVTGSQTVVGSSDNKFTYELNENTKADNYVIVAHEGTLTVTSRDAKYEVTVKANSATATYDGKEHEAKGVEAYEFTVNEQKYTVSGLSTEDPKQADAGKYTNNITGTPVVKDAKGNDVSSEFTVKTENGSLVIDKATVKLKSADLEKTYDGTALTNGETALATETGWAKGEGATYTFAGSQTNAGSSENTFTYELKSNTKASNYNAITPEYGTLKVNPVTDEVTIKVKGNQETKTYNGSKQQTTGFSVEGELPAGLASSEVVLAEGASARAEGTNVGIYNMDLSEDSFALSEQASKNFENVKFEVEDGWLEITPAETIDGVTWNTQDEQKAYDGTALSAYAASATDKYGNRLDVEYSADGENWVSDPTQITITHFGYTKVQLRATGSNYKSGTYVESSESIAITKRLVTLTSATASKVYDGTELTDATVTVTPKGEGVGFVDGEGVTCDVTGSQTAAGSSENDFTYSFNNGTSADDYSVTAKAGTLTVTPNANEVVVTVKGNSDSVVYDGTEHTVSGYEVVGITGGNGKFTESDVDLKDGVELSVSGTNVNVDKDGNVVAYAQSLNASDFVSTNRNFSKVTFVVDPSAPSVSLTVTKRPVTLTSGSDEKAYDGTPLTNSEVTATAFDADKKVGFVDGEGFTAKATGTITNAGSVNNEFTYALNSDTSANNYSISTVEGKLTVTKLAAANLKLSGTDVTAVYDGDSHSAGTATVAPVDNDGNSLADFVKTDDVKIEYQFAGDGWENWYTDPSAVTQLHATSEAMKVNVRASSPNFDGYATTTETITVTKRPVQISTKSASKVYDGTALTTKNDWDGYENGPRGKDAGILYTDFAGYPFIECTGSQTEVGSSKNTFEYKIKEDRLRDYEVHEPVLGMLTVTAKPISDNDITATAPDDVVYDGEEHQLKPTVKFGETTLKEGEDYDLSWSEDITNAGTVTVTITGKGNYTGTRTVEYKITPRPVTLKSNDHTWTYDGAEHSDSAVSVTSELGFVDGEVSDLKANGVVSTVSQGEVTNNITFTKNSSYKDANYKVELNEGKLQVKAKDLNAQNMSVGTLDNVVYNGLDQKLTPEVKDGKTVLAEGTDYTVEYSKDVKNVGTVKVTVKGKGNYTGSVERAYQITPAALTVTTPSASQVYNGKALTAEGEISGFVNDETATFATTGSQKEVGRRTNTYSLAWDGTASEANYTVSEKLGTLTVTETEEEVVVTATGGTYTYDGRAYGATVTVSDLPEGYTLEAAASSASATDVNKDENDGKGVKVTADTLVIRNADGKDVTSELKVTKIDGYLLINPANVTVTTPSASKVYDGTALKAEGSISGLINNETVDFKTTGSQTDEGESSNAYSLEWTGTAKQSNYTVSEKLGKLTVSKQSIDKDDKDKDSYKGIEINDPTSAKYDAADHKWAPTVTDANGNKLTEGADYTVTYKRGDDETSDFKNAGTITVIITGKGNYTGTVTKSYEITKRQVTLTSDSGSKNYDGKTITRHGVTVSGDGFAKGENVSENYTWFDSDFIEPGRYTNKFEYQLKNGTDASNYEIKTVFGELTINKASAKSGIKLTANDASKMYDGQALEAAAATAKAKVSGNTVKVEYSTDQKSWTEDLSSITAANVSDSKTVYVRASSENYEGYATATAKLEVTKRTVELTSKSASKVYDGTALTAPEVEVSGDGFVEGEVENLSATGSALNAGDSVVNEIAYDAKKGFDSNNYTVTKHEGTLSVSAQSIVPGEDGESDDSYKGVGIDAPSDVEYDGKAHQWKPAVTDKDGNKLVEGTDYTVTYTRDGKEVTDFTNVTGVITVTVTGKGNYTGTAERSYQITAAPLTVTTEGATKVYDGEALTNDKATVNGLKNGETVTIHATGTQTKVGDSSNGYKLTWDGTASESNYSITAEEISKLVVTETAEQIVATPLDVTVQYDGQAHGTSVQVSNLPKGYAVKTAKSNASVTNVADGDVTAAVDELVIVNAEGEDVTSKLDIDRGTATIKVTPVTLTAVTESAEKVYDGEALTEEGGSLTGFVNGEFAELVTTGSQTYVGKSDNTYEIKWTGADEKNYTVVSTLGALVVTAKGANNDKVITKSHKAGTYKLGETVEFTITATNIYDTAKTLTIYEMDGVKLSQSTFANVAPGASVTATAAYTIQEKDIQAGTFVNTASVKFSGGEEFSNTDTVTVEDKNAHLSVEKVTTSTPKNGSTYALGETISYDVTVTNDGNVTVSDVTTTDSLPGAKLAAGQSANVGELAPGESATVKYVYTVTEADVVAGKVTNGATASGNSSADKTDVTPGETSDEIEPGHADLVVTKKVTSEPANGSAYALGETIEYAITVKNNGNLTAKNFQVVDENADSFSPVTIGELAPGATSQVIKATHVVTEADILTGKVTNVATTTGGNTDSPKVTPSPEPGEADADVVAPDTTLEVTKVAGAAQNGSYKLGEEVSFTITVTNKGNVAYHNVKVSDEQTGLSETIETLAVGEARTFTTTHTITEDDLVKGFYANTATATADPVTDPKSGEDVTPSGTDTETISTEEVESAITVTKTAAAGSYAAGDTVEYTITVANTGNVTVYDINVVDAKTGLSETVTLAKGETRTFTTSYVVTDEDIAAGTLSNTATATGTDPKGNEVEGSDTEVIDDATQPDPDNPEKPTLKRELNVSELNDVEYNGQSQQLAPAVTDKYGNLLVEGADYVLSYSADTTNVGEVTVTVTGIGNYAGVIDRSYNITPAALTITTGSAVKAYDGTALTSSEIRIEGLKGTDAVSAATTGTITEVGSATNTYSIDWLETDKNNYTVTENLGELVVSAAAVVPNTPANSPASPTSPTNVNTSVIDAIADALADAAATVTGEQDDETEQIFDAENPLGKAEHVACWVHFYMILGMVVTLLYGLSVDVRRRRFSGKLASQLNDVLGGTEGSEA